MNTPAFKPGTRFDELIRKVRGTAGARFNASKRLERHHRASQWAIAFLSVALIVLPLMQLVAITSAVPAGALSVVSIGLAVAVLALSLLLGMENFAVRALRMHQCGLELNALQRSLESFRGQSGTDDEYKRYCGQYTRIMDKYDNHEDVDYWRHQRMYRSEHPSVDWRIHPRFLFAYWFQFVPYIVSVGGVLILLYVLVP